MGNDKSTNSTNKRAIIIISAIIAVILVSIIGYNITISNKVKSWESKVYPGVSVYGIDIGELTKEEATEKLNKELPSVIMDKKLDVLVEDKKLELKYSDITPSYDYNAISEEAVAYGKNEKTSAKNKMINKAQEHEISAKLVYDEGKLKEFEDRVKSEVNVEPQDAQISISSGNISITPDVVGKKINEEELHNKLVENINGDPTDIIELKFDLVESLARIKESDLKKITGRMSSYSSSYVDNGDGRTTNMRIASDIINGTLLMPGDEFSYNGLIGDTTPDKGYKIANTYVGGEIVPDYGGGICQVSTTLYRAVMRSNLRSTERMNHSMIVSYSEPGLDATVANGVIDYKFVNTYDFPVYIEGYVGGGAVTFNIYGDPAGLGGKTYELVNEVLETYPPEKEYVDDANLLEGQEEIKSSGMTGYKAKAYQVTYENGVEVNREHISTDNYLTLNTIVKRGTKKPQ
ncbi:VanW family protein [Clostridium sp.]|uniref:VanW family protein n=1 Tax=Clostridium sp. TaxID=1506 RepID=UPI003F369421